MNMITAMIVSVLCVTIVYIVGYKAGEARERDRETKSRPCEVEGSKALFHGWVVDENARFLALVEYIDGTVDRVRPERVKFTDH